MEEIIRGKSPDHEHASPQPHSATPGMALLAHGLMLVSSLYLFSGWLLLAGLAGCILGKIHENRSRRCRDAFQTAHGSWAFRTGIFQLLTFLVPIVVFCVIAYAMSENGTVEQLQALFSSGKPYEEMAREAFSKKDLVAAVAVLLGMLVAAVAWPAKRAIQGIVEALRGNAPASSWMVSLLCALASIAVVALEFTFMPV